MLCLTNNAPMKHEILGEVELSNGNPFDAVAKIKYSSRDISLGVSRDAQSLETSLALASDVVSDLPSLDKLAKQVAAKDLLQTYNNGWNEYDEVQEDGTLKSVINPQLSERGFEAKLSLREVHITGEGTVDFFYDDEGMFWGHTIVVTSFDGTDFTNAHAEFFG